jgi:hypothetical protein
MPKVVADAIDQVISLEMRFKAGLPRGVIRPLYEEARRVQGGDPLVYLAGTRLKETVGKRDFVLIVTGSGQRFGLHKGETDGPPGAASLARVLDFGLGARCVLVCDPDHVDPIVATVEAAGISVIDAERLERRPHTTVIEQYPLGPEAGRPFARQLLDRYQPKAVVFIEKTGPNTRGTHHSITGTEKNAQEIGHAYHLAELAREQGIFTLGVGDGGNEVGNGVIREAVERIQPHGPTVACATSTDVLISAGVSNWGAYGAAAFLAYLLKDPELFQNEELEATMLRQCVAAGGTDGAYAAQILSVDGTNLRTNVGLVSILQEIIRNGLKEVDRGF